MRLKLNQANSFGTKKNDNKLIYGDNRKALPLISSEFHGKIRCIYIDPPYNNGDNFKHYNDKKTHEQWIADKIEILALLKPFLSEDGSIWISIDESEMHYLKVAADNVFGRQNFLTTIVWQQRTTRENRSVFSRNHEYILVYATNPRVFKNSRGSLPMDESVALRYKNPDNDPRGDWQSISANVQDGHATKSQFYEIIAPNGKTHIPPNGRCWVYNKARMESEIKNKNIWFGKDGNAVPRIKKFLNNANSGLTPETLWLGNEVGTNKSAKKHLLSLFPDGSIFDTPKPEQLIQRIFQIATNENDWVLDCYSGSGSTLSTAHKMNRKYIGIEIGSQIVDCITKRLLKVIEGEQGGISIDVGWTKGGGFKFFDLSEKS